MHSDQIKRLQLQVPKIPKHLSKMLQNNKNYNVKRLVRVENQNTIMTHQSNKIDYFKIDGDEGGLVHNINDVRFYSKHVRYEGKQDYLQLPEWNIEQNQIRNNIKKERGRYFFLSDLYNEIDNDIARTNTYYRKRWRPTKPQKYVIKEDQPEYIKKVEEQLVSELDGWYNKNIIKSNPEQARNFQRVATLKIQAKKIKIFAKKKTEISLLQFGLLDNSMLEVESILKKTQPDKPVAFAAFRKAQKSKRLAETSKKAKTTLLQKLKNARSYVAQKHMNDTGVFSGKPNVDLKKIMTMVQKFFENNTIFTLEKLEKAEELASKTKVILRDFQHYINNLNVYIRTKFNTMSMLRKENHVILYKNIRLKDLLKQKNAAIEIKIDKLKTYREARKGKTSREELRKMVLGQSDGQEIALFQQNYDWFLRKIHYNKKQISIMVVDYKLAQQMVAALEQMRRGFLQNLLKLGVVPMKDGLTWNIKEILRDGDIVKMVDLPDFLDEKAKTFLIKRAHDQQEIEEEKMMKEVSRVIFDLKFQPELEQLQNEGIGNIKRLIELDHDSDSSFQSERTSLDLKFDLPEEEILDPDAQNKASRDEELDLSASKTLLFEKKMKNNYPKLLDSRILPTRKPQGNEIIFDKTMKVITSPNVQDQQVILSESWRHQKRQTTIKEEDQSVQTDDIYNMPEIDILNEVFANSEANVPEGPLQRRYMKQVYDHTITNLHSILHHKKEIIDKNYAIKSKFKTEEIKELDLSKEDEEDEKIYQSQQEVPEEILENNESDHLQIWQDQEQIYSFKGKSTYNQMTNKLSRSILHLKRNLQAKDQFEIMRLTKRFNLENYEREFNTNPDIVFATLFGVEVGLKELQLQGFNTRLFQKRVENNENQEI